MLEDSYVVEEEFRTGKKQKWVLPARIVVLDDSLGEGEPTKVEIDAVRVGGRHYVQTARIHVSSRSVVLGPP